MRTWGILFRPELAEKIRQGVKTQTRRVPFVSQVVDGVVDPTKGWGRVRTGDRLYVKETIYRDPATDDMPEVVHYGDGSGVMVDGKNMTWRWPSRYLSSLHMPMEAARTWLVATADARLELLHSITESDAKAEGFQSDAEFYAQASQLAHLPPHQVMPTRLRLARDAFLERWMEINGKRTWRGESVFVLSFRLTTDADTARTEGQLEREYEEHRRARRRVRDA